MQFQELPTHHTITMHLSLQLCLLMIFLIYPGKLHILKRSLSKVYLYTFYSKPVVFSYRYLLICIIELKSYFFSFSTVHSDVELHQKFLMTKPTTKLAKIECTFPSECRFYIHWYQKKNGEPFKRVQYVDIDDQSICNEPGFETLKSEKRGNKFVLIIPNLKREHSATYYCACWVDYHSEIKSTNPVPKHYTAKPLHWRQSCRVHH